MSGKFTARSSDIRKLMKQGLTKLELLELASGANPNIDERKAARMMLEMGHYITGKKEAGK